MSVARSGQPGQTGHSSHTEPVLAKHILMLKERYNYVLPSLEWVKTMKRQLEPVLGDRWAEGLFTTDQWVSEVGTHRRTLRDFWGSVQELCKTGLLDDSFFDATWAARARDYRLLMEPIDIANYYFHNLHKQSGHYIDGIVQELSDDNNRRLGRYRLLQQQEQRVFGSQDPTYTAQSSLGLARLLKAMVGDMTWYDYMQLLDGPSAVILAAAGNDDNMQLLDGPSAVILTAAGNDDCPAEKYSLGIGPMAKGTATFLLDPQTAATTMAVYARWGSGKSTFMKLVEAEMLMKAAQTQIDAMQRRHDPQHKNAQKAAPAQIDGMQNHSEHDSSHDDEPKTGGEPTPGGNGWLLAQRFDKLKKRHESPDALSADDWMQLKALASPRLLTVWFNSWQYLTEEQVWSGLVVEVTQRLEEKLGHEQRRVMRGWWIVSPWDFLWLLLVPMRLLAGFAYNWRARRADVILRCMLPSLLVLVVVGACMGFGIWELQQQAKAPSSVGATKADKDARTAFQQLPINKSAVAAIAVAGLITGLLAPFLLAISQCKQMSDYFIAARSHVKFADYTAKIGYQHAVIKDLQLLRVLLSKAFKPFSSEQTDCCTALGKACCCGSLAAALRALLRSLTKVMAYLLLCCCGCCLRHNKRVLQNSLLCGEQSQAEMSSAGQADATNEKEPRIVVFIDDLDRCKPTKVIELKQYCPLTSDMQVLEAINLVLAGSGFVVVVGMDKKFITSAIQSAYKDIKIMSNEEKAVEFLEKIVQVELTLPTPAPKELLEFLQAQGVQRTTVADVEVVISSPPIPPVMPPVGDAAAEPVTSPALDTRNEQEEAKKAVLGLDSAINHAKDEAASAGRAAAGAHRAAEAVAQKCGAMSAQANNARRNSTLAVKKAQEAQLEALIASKQGTTAQSELKQGAYSSALTAAAEAQQAAGRALQAARDAKAAQQRVAEVLANVSGPQYSAEESALICFLHRVGLLQDTTPRDMKRMLNRYQLAKHITQVAYPDKVDFDAPELLAWVVLWWRYPLAMCALIKLKGSAPQPDQAAATRRLVDLLQQVQWQQQAEDSTAGSGTAAATVSDTTASSTPSSSGDRPIEQQERGQQQLDAAGAAAAAKLVRAAANAAVATAEDDAAKKKAEKALKEADTKMQLAELWGLCSGPEDSSGSAEPDSAEQQQRATLNLKTAVMDHAVYRLFCSMD